ncbi:fungal specific transcription factor domain-containing protein [Sarocladium implicatum]|nr:fungal specific transcription factor domain-containing protein [Sarocladium implicatum]
MWIQPLYPLLSDEELLHLRETALARSTETQDAKPVHRALVMALGATTLPNTLKEMQVDASKELRIPLASSLYEEAIARFESSSQDFRPSLSLITTLLLFCIHSSYQATRYTQWQLAGLAMRVS